MKKYVPSWRKLSKSWSIWSMTIVFAVLSFPDLLPVVAAYLPPEWAKWFALAGIGARAIKQGYDDANR